MEVTEENTQEEDTGGARRRRRLAGPLCQPGHPKRPLGPPIEVRAAALAWMIAQYEIRNAEAETGGAAAQ